MKLQKILLYACLTRCEGAGAGGAALPLVLRHVAHVEGLDEAAVFRLIAATRQVVGGGGGSRRGGIAVVAEEVCVVCEYRNGKHGKWTARLECGLSTDLSE